MRNGIGWHARVNLAIKQPNVDKHINLMSQSGDLFGGPVEGGWGLYERKIAGADIEKSITGTTHQTLDDEYYPPTCELVSSSLRHVYFPNESSGARSHPEARYATYEIV